MSICNRFLKSTPFLQYIHPDLVANRSKLFCQFNYKSFSVGYETDRPSEAAMYRPVTTIKFSIHWKVAKKLAMLRESEWMNPRYHADVFAHSGGRTFYHWELPKYILMGIERNHVHLVGGKYTGVVSEIRRFWNGSQLRISCDNHPDFDVNIEHRLGEQSPYAVGHKVQFTVLQGIGARLAGNHCWRKTWRDK